MRGTVRLCCGLNSLVSRGDTHVPPLSSGCGRGLGLWASIAVADLDLNCFVRKFQQRKPAGGLGQNRCGAEGRQIQIGDFKLDLQWVDLPFPQGSPVK